MMLKVTGFVFYN